MDKLFKKQKNRIKMFAFLYITSLAFILSFAWGTFEGIYEAYQTNHGNSNSATIEQYDKYVLIAIIFICFFLGRKYYTKKLRLLIQKQQANDIEKGG